MTEYKTVRDNKKAIRQFNYVIAKYRGQTVKGRIKRYELSSTRNKIGLIELDTKSIFKYIVPSDYDSITLVDKQGNKYNSKITLNCGR
jgi:hypothetical protein